MKLIKYFVIASLWGGTLWACEKREPLTSYINPFIGTSDDHGQTDPSATIPFGMVKPGPETSPRGNSGYDYQAHYLKGFTQTRMSGVGCVGTGGNLLVLPFAGNQTKKVEMDKTTEKATPGYYAVKLLNGVKAEMTAGRTSAFYRFTYPATANSGLKINFRSSFARMIEEEHRVVNGNAIGGFVKSACVCDLGAYTFYYYMELSEPATQVTEGDGNLFWHLNTLDNRTVYLKIGLSTVSIDNARENLLHETGNKTFDDVRLKAGNCWENLLKTVEVTTCDQDLKTSFYTRLYQACQTPFGISDYNGAFRGSDGKVYQVENGIHYHGWSIWDTYRTKHPLLSILYPAEYKDMLASLIKLYKQGKPRSATLTEPFLTTRTEHSIIVLLDAWQKGLIGGSLKEIMPLIVKEADATDEDSPDKMLEKCYDYWGVSELYRELGDREQSEVFKEKSHRYRDIWNEKFRDIDPASDIMHGDGLYEGTIWQYRWFVPHDLDWMVEAIGSREKTIGQLDYFFRNNLFSMGNQPDIQAPFLYYYLGEPWKSQKVVHDILHEPTVNYYGTHEKWKKPYVGKIFKTSPEGYLKEMDDDAGTMSSWFVLSSMGLFPVCPGVPRYWVLPSSFESVSIRVDSGKHFAIKTVRSSKEDIYIKKATLNGKELDRSWISYEEIRKGGELVLELTDKPVHE